MSQLNQQRIAAATGQSGMRAARATDTAKVLLDNAVEDVIVA